MTRQSPNSPFLLSDDGSRIVGIRQPDGVESFFAVDDGTMDGNVQVSDGTSYSAVGSSLASPKTDPRVAKIVPTKTLGTKLVDHIGANNLIDANSSFITGSKASMRNAAPTDFSRSNSGGNLLKMVATGTDISINAT